MRPGRPRAHQGASAIELLVVVVLSGVVIRAAWSLLEHHSRAAYRAEQTVSRLDAVRTLRAVLGNELRQGRPGRDWTVDEGDSLGLRALRGVALVCSGDGSGAFEVRYRGSRRPVPEKDSVLVLTGAARWSARNLAAVTPGTEASPPSIGSGFGAGPTPGSSLEVSSCPAEGPAWSQEIWTVPGVPESALMFRLFERGSYHLAGGAFRYRSGAGGRQPLTEQVFRDGGTTLANGATAAGEGPWVRIRLSFPSSGRSDSVPPWDLHFRPSRTSTTTSP